MILLDRHFSTTVILLGGMALGLCVPAAGPAPLYAEARILTGWGGGKPEEIVPKAAAIGFAELVVDHQPAANFARYVELGQQHHIGIYGCLSLGDLAAWKQTYPDSAPPLQVMSAVEEEVRKRIQADPTPDKSRYQFGGEPVNDTEVLVTPLLCFHDPRVMEVCKRQIEEILKVPRVKGVAFDFIGYQNYRCCRCPQSQTLLAAHLQKHPGDSPERFALETLVDFNNRLAAHARAVNPAAQVITHVYPTFLPEPLYGNRLDVDVCAQTAAWFFEPFWSTEKIRGYTRTITNEAHRHYPRPHGAALIGYSRQSVKSAERLTAELQAILDGGCSRVHVSSFEEVLTASDAAEVFRKFFGHADGQPTETH